MTRLRVLTGLLTLGLAGALAAAPAAGATTTHRLPGARVAAHSSLGSTTVTTAPGVAGVLLGAGIAPLPVLPKTGFRANFAAGGLQVGYRFPITRSTADLASGTGNIVHSGGIAFVSGRAQLTLTRFDISIGDGKVYATRVNGAAARVPVLDLDLSALRVSTDPAGDTVLSHIGAYLDPAAAGALNSTFGTALPTDGSLLFGSARVVLK